MDDRLKPLLPKKIRHKWGFGMSPVSDAMESRYFNATQEVANLMNSSIPVSKINIDLLSDFKGMINRCLKKDQWDWFTVYSRMGNPPIGLLSKIASLISDLRTKAKNSDFQAAEELIPVLVKLQTSRIITNFLGESESPSTGWLYILSTREQDNVLKIGMTTRNLTQRVKEINSVTGVLFPFSVRGVFKVADPEAAERMAFELLKDFRIRLDREFFEIPFGLAQSKIKALLIERNLLVNDWV